MSSPRLSVVSTREHPVLVPVVADWLWEAFWRDSGWPRDELDREVQSSVTADRLPRTFVLCADEQPVGTASLVAEDLEERPHLTPWLAGVFVIPGARGRNYVRHLIAAVEAEARSAAIDTLWLYTDTAERVYARAGWRTVETVEHRSKASPGRIKPVALMRRDLASAEARGGPVDDRDTPGGALSPLRER
jgi:GNAT superfamily N-acetyltransferase